MCSVVLQFAAEVNHSIDVLDTVKSDDIDPA